MTGLALSLSDLVSIPIWQLRRSSDKPFPNQSPLNRSQPICHANMGGVVITDCPFWAMVYVAPAFERGPTRGSLFLKTHHIPHQENHFPCLCRCRAARASCRCCSSSGSWHGHFSILKREVQFQRKENDQSLARVGSICCRTFRVMAHAMLIGRTPPMRSLLWRQKDHALKDNSLP